jgi:hypothetical protein
MHSVENSLSPTAPLSVLCTTFHHLTTSYPALVYKYATEWQLLSATLYALQKRETDERLVHFHHSLRLLLTRENNTTSSPLARLLIHCQHDLDDPRHSLSLSEILVLFVLASSLTEHPNTWSREDIKASKKFLIQWILNHPQHDPLSMRLLDSVQSLLTTHFSTQSEKIATTTSSSEPTHQNLLHQHESKSSKTLNFDKVTTQQLRLALEDLVEVWLERLSQLSLLRGTLQDYR